MDTNCRPVQGCNPPPAGVDPNAPNPAVGGDWRAQLDPELRSRIFNWILETLKKHLPVALPEGLPEVHRIALRFEEQVYMSASSQAEYMRKFSVSMLSTERGLLQGHGNAQVIPNQDNPNQG